MNIKNRPVKKDKSFKLTKNQREKAGKLRMLQIVDENLKLAKRLIYAFDKKSTCPHERETTERNKQSSANLSTKQIYLFWKRKAVR